jgi:hypothetical protein
MMAASASRSITILGGGPVGLQIGLTLRQRDSRSNITIVTEDHPHQGSQPATAAWPAAAGYAQPFHAAEDPRMVAWWHETYSYLSAIGDERLVSPVSVDYFHREQHGYRPWWSNTLRCVELEAPSHANGCTAGFQWDSYVIDALAFHNYMNRQVRSAGIEIRSGHIANFADVDAVAANTRADVVVDALGISSGSVFGDEHFSGRIGHLMAWPNIPGDRKVSMIEEDTMYVISGPSRIVAGGTYDPCGPEPAELQAAFDQPLDPKVEERLWSALYALRPDLIAILADSPPTHIVGVRPFRSLGPRVEIERRDQLSIVHAGGLGGSGWSVFVGVANTAADLVHSELR